MTIDTTALEWHPGKALRDIRRDVLGMSQEAFAVHMEGIDGRNWDQPKVSEYETGKRSPTLKEMKAWARGFGLPLRLFTEGELDRDKGLYRNRPKALFNRPVPLAQREVA